jgi:hypothetical protein
MKDHFMGGITQKGGSAGHQGQDALFAFLAQIFLGHPFPLSDESSTSASD